MVVKAYLLSYNQIKDLIQVNEKIYSVFLSLSLTRTLESTFQISNYGIY